MLANLPKFLRMLSKINDTEWRAPRIDPSTHAMKSIDYEHSEIHGSNHYFIAQRVDLAINNVRDIRVTTPNTTKWAHFVIAFDCESETNILLHENAVITTAGTSFTAFNNNRNSSNIAGLSVDYIDNATLVLADADTDITTATNLGDLQVGAGRVGGNVIRQKEMMLKQNTIYNIRIIANTAGNINFIFDWYEHTNKD